MRMRFLVLAATALALLATACEPEIVEEEPVDADTDAADEGGLAEEIEDVDGDVPVIAYISHTQDITDLFGQMLVGMENRLEELGFEYELITGAPQASDDHEGMDRILNDLQAANPDYVVFGPTSFELNQPRLADLEDGGSEIVMTDYEPPEDIEVTINPSTWVIYDHNELGYNAGEAVARDHCDRGTENVQVAMFWGPPASEISQDRGEGALEAIEDVAEECDGMDWELVEEVFADFDREQAFNHMETVATAHPDLDVAIGANSNTALGMMEAADLAGVLDQIDIVGMGGQLDELAAVCRGDIHNAPNRDERDMGHKVAEAIVNHAEGNLDEIDEFTYTDLPVLEDCQDVFDVVPRDMLEEPDFRELLDEGQWEEFAG